MQPADFPSANVDGAAPGLDAAQRADPAWWHVRRGEAAALALNAEAWRLDGHEIAALRLRDPGAELDRPAQGPPRLLPLVARESTGATSAGNAVTPSQLLPRRAETHWVQFNVVDHRGNPVGGLPYRLLDPGASVLEKDTLPMSGKLRKDGIEPGSYTLELGELTAATWQVDGRVASGALPVKTTLSLAVTSAHVPPGTAAKFKVFRLYDEEPGRALATIDAKVGGDGGVQAAYTFTPGDADHGREVALIYSCTIGKLWIKSPPLTMALPALRAARWNAGEVTVGDTATLMVLAPGFADGENVHFTLFRTDTGAAVAELDAPVLGGAAETSWTTVDPDPKTPASELNFEAACSGLATRSRTMRLLDDVEFVFEGDNGRPLADVRVLLKYTDGTHRSFKTDSAGVLRLTDPRARSARVEVAEAEELSER